MIVFPLLWLPRVRQFNKGFLAVDWSDEYARVIYVFAPVWILGHCERPFILFTLAPRDGQARKVKRKIQTTDQRSTSYRRPEHPLHELRTRVQRELRREKFYIGDRCLHVLI